MKLDWLCLRIKRFGGKCIGYMLHLFFFLPIRRNRVLIYAFEGWQYYCNPKYISEYLVKSGRNLEIIWGLRHPRETAGIEGVKTTRLFSFAWFYYSLTASVLIISSALSRSQPKRKGQLIVETWHGGGAYKHIVMGIAGLKAADRYPMKETVNRIDLFLSSSRMFTEYAIRQDFRYTGEVLCCGMPRNDLFFDGARKASAAAKIKDMLGVTGRVILYAPTYRGPNGGWFGRCTNGPFPYEAVLTALRQRYGEPVTLLRRAHPGTMLPDESGEGVLDVSDYPDMQELLCAADMLITDYSSSMWDFALLGRPCLLYMPDLERYAAEQGICTPVEEWPGIVCKSETELLEAIRSFDERSCAQRAERHLRAFGSYETGTATQQVCERILRHLDQKGPDGR